MATQALQRANRPYDLNQSRLAGGPVTGQSYVVNQLGYAIVSTLDAPFFVASGEWISAPWYEAPDYPSSGVATLQFGAFPGASTAQTIITVANLGDLTVTPFAEVVPIATADHTADEHSADPPRVNATLSGNTLTINAYQSGRDLPVPAGTPFGNTAGSQQPIGNQQAQPYGAWSVLWSFA